MLVEEVAEGYMLLCRSHQDRLGRPKMRPLLKLAYDPPESLWLQCLFWERIHLPLGYHLLGKELNLSLCHRENTLTHLIGEGFL